MYIVDGTLADHFELYDSWRRMNYIKHNDQNVSGMCNDIMRGLKMNKNTENKFTIKTGDYNSAIVQPCLVTVIVLTLTI